MTRSATPADVLSGAARWAVVEGDAAAAVRALPAGCLDAVVTDPPSGIAFMGAEWDRDKGGRAQWVAWLAEVLGLARAATRDGGRALVWSLPRTSHWTGCAVEDAGWSIESTITHLFGTGWPKGQSQLKPAAETWWLARTGRSEALNIEACRVGTASTRGMGSGRSAAWEGGAMAGAVTGSSEGRYPPNVVLSHSPGCVLTGNAWECAEGCPVRELDEQSGELTSNAVTRAVERGLGYGGGAGSVLQPREKDTGTASRFFPQFPADPAVFGYHAKPSRAERDAGVSLDARPADAYAAHRHRRMEGEPERFDGAPVGRCANTHPTVKSIALMRWLVRLVSQRGQVILDTFAGSGTTGVAALAEGRRVILIEREPRYAEIARQRCESGTFDLGVPVRVAPKAAPVAADPRQLSLLGGAR